MVEYAYQENSISGGEIGAAKQDFGRQIMKNQDIQLVPANVSLAEQVVDYYQRNRGFLEAFEPVRNEEFFSLNYQKEILKKEMIAYVEKNSFRFYITPAKQPTEIIGIIGLNNVVWGAFRSAFLGYKLDKDFLNQGYMSMAVEMVTRYAFEALGLHRIEANVMPKNKASLRVLEKNHFVNEGLSKYYLNINGVWEDHIHMVKINYAMH
jgi:ribosomal-protein-alanine N-acetyltransferase